MSYAEVLNEDKSSNQIYIWGNVPMGLNLKLQKVISQTPTILPVENYKFKQLKIHKDFAIGIGHAFKVVI